MANLARAYILIECTVGRTKDVITGLRHLKGVKSVETVTGPYDAIAIVEVATLNEIGDLVTQHIHPITGITRTVTCLVV
jgi:DNA-binding Lrp family transcriptional regulator